MVAFLQVKDGQIASMSPRTRGPAWADSPSPPQEETTLPTPWSWTLVLPNCEMTNSCCLSHPADGTEVVFISKFCFLRLQLPAVSRSPDIPEIKLPIQKF